MSIPTSPERGELLTPVPVVNECYVAKFESGGKGVLVTKEFAKVQAFVDELGREMPVGARITIERVTPSPRARQIGAHRG